jgi:DNA repair exonuclease SbcCD nuclease subunit
MNSITFFHCADLHLDTPFRNLASKPGLPALRRKEILNGLTRLIDNAREEKPDFLFIPGDLFEHGYTGLRTVSAVNSLFASIPETKIVLIAGNHDPEAANSHYKTYAWSSNVTFIGSDSDSVYFEDLNTEVFGLGWVSGTGQAAKLETMETDESRINVLMFHGDVDLQIGDNDYNSISSGLLKSKGFDYVAAGHNHKKKTGGNSGIFYNPGSLEPLGFDEPGRHGYFMGTISRNYLPDVKFIENATTVYKTIELDISGLDTNQLITESIIPQLVPENVLYKIVLNGTKHMDFNPDTELIGEAISDAALFAKVRDDSSVSIQLDEILLMKGLKGEFARLILKKIEVADEDERDVFEKALYYGIEAIDNGKIERAGGEDL